MNEDQLTSTDLAAFDAATESSDVGQIFDTAVAGEQKAKSLSMSDIPKIAAAPLVATSQMFNPMAAAIKATYQSYKEGTPFGEAYTENMARIREAQDQILKSSPTAEAFGTVGSLGAAIAMPGTKIAGATLGALETARGASTVGEAIEKGAVGAGAGVAFGAMGQRALKTIPSADRVREVIAPKKAVEWFNASTENLQNYLKAIPGDTLSSKMQRFGDFLFKKAVVGSGKAIDQVERQAHEMGTKIQDSISRIKSIAIKEDPRVSSLDIYEEIRDKVIAMQPDEKIQAVTEKLFSALEAGDDKALGMIKLSGLIKIKDIAKRKVDRLYNKPYDKLTAVEKDLVDGFDILRESIDDTIERVIQEKVPEKAGEFARLRTEGHMIFQLKRFAKDRAAEKSAKQMDKNIASGGIMQSIINRVGKALTTAPEKLAGGSTPVAIGAMRDLLSKGQKIPYAMGDNDPYSQPQQ